MTGSRDITATTLAAAQAATIHPVTFVKIAFDGGDVNLHSELGDITFGGDTFSGVGKLGQIGNISENSDLSHSQVTLTLSGIPNDIASILLNEHYQGRLCTIYAGYLDLTTNILVDTPTIRYRGLVDTADMEAGDTSTISVIVGNRFASWNTPNVRRYNNANQQSRYPGDNGLRFLEKTTNKTIIWGGAK